MNGLEVSLYIAATGRLDIAEESTEDCARGRCEELAICLAVSLWVREWPCGTWKDSLASVECGVGGSA